MKQQSDLQRKICQRIERVLKRKRIKKKELAKVLDLTPSLISRMLSGQSAMSITQFDKICSFLSFDAFDLLYDSKKTDFTTHFYDEKESDLWCSDERAIYLLVHLLKSSLSEKEILNRFPKETSIIKKVLKTLAESNLMTKKTDGSYTINPPDSPAYNISSSKKYPACLLKIFKAQLEKYHEMSEDWKNKSISISKTNLNWFTEAQLNYIKEQINNMHFAITGFLMDNGRKQYRDVNRMHLIALNCIEVFGE